MSDPAGDTPDRPSRRRVVTGPWVPRAWLWCGELTWYVAVAVFAVLSPRILRLPPATNQVVHDLITVVAALTAAAALLRWWTPRWTARIALAAIGVGVIVLVVVGPGSLGPLRLMLSMAVVPVLLTATVRRAGTWTAVVTVLSAALWAGLDGARRGNTLSVHLAKVLAQAARPSTALIVATATGLVLLPLTIGLLLRAIDAARRAEKAAILRAEERLRVARELHDVVANHVTGMIVVAQAAVETAAPPPPSRAAFVAIEDAGNRALRSMRCLVDALRSVQDSEPSFPADVRANLPAAVRSPRTAVLDAVGADQRVHVRVGGDCVVVPERVAAAHGATVGPESGDGPPPAPSIFDAPADPVVLLTLHRIVLESLTNARRYMASGSDIHLTLCAPRPSVLRLDRHRLRPRLGHELGQRVRTDRDPGTHRCRRRQLRNGAHRRPPVVRERRAALLTNRRRGVSGGPDRTPRPRPRPPSGSVRRSCVPRPPGGPSPSRDRA